MPLTVLFAEDSAVNKRLVSCSHGALCWVENRAKGIFIQQLTHSFIPSANTYPACTNDDSRSLGSINESR